MSRGVVVQNRGVNVDDMGAGLRQALTRAESLNLSLQKEVNMVRAISKVFFATWRLDLLLDNALLLTAKSQVSIFILISKHGTLYLSFMPKRKGSNYFQGFQRTYDLF